MAKDVQRGESVYIAPGITGKRDDNGKLTITDDLGKQLYPEKNIEDKIRIFERQVNGWFLEPASTLLKGKNNGFVILMIATAYIEGVEQYRKGESSSNRNSGKFFKGGIKRVLKMDSNENSRLHSFYRELRCGLFHNGMTGPNIRISSGYENPIDFSDGNIIKINQELFLEKVKEDFEQYLKDLTTKSDLKDNFNKMYKPGEDER